MRQLRIILALLLITVSCQVTESSSSSQAAKKDNNLFRLPKEEKREGFKVLFDGTSMSQWTSNTDEYVLENGCIVMYPKTPEANSGLVIRHKMISAPSGYDGMELQILDNEAPIYKELKPYQYHGSVYGWIPAKRGFLKPAGEWNSQEVIADGDNIKVILNGTVIVDGNLREATKDTPADKVPATLFYKKGHIAFLGHNSVVKFKNIRIKELKH